MRSIRNTYLGKHVLFYPSPRYLNYNWGLGSVLGLMVVFQVISGVLLACYYRPVGSTAFSDIIFIVNDVSGGYFIKYLHLNGASVIFLVMYAHMFRGLYYRSYAALPRVWLSGMLLFVLMIVAAFLGYVLPWGQMSYWAATVITNLVTSLPVVGQKVIIVIHGAFSVQDATLSRFFVFHYLIAIIILALAALHVAFLHADGSTAPAARAGPAERAPFYFYYAYKDLFFFAAVCFFYATATLLYPNALNHPDNFIEANPLVTPAHIVPEWYFLPFYAILRAVPNKLFGVIAMLASLLVLAALPLFSKRPAADVESARLGHEVFFFGLLLCYLVLAHLGSMPATSPYVEMSQLFAVLYFVVFAAPSVGRRIYARGSRGRGGALLGAVINFFRGLNYRLRSPFAALVSLRAVSEARRLLSEVAAQRSPRQWGRLALWAYLYSWALWVFTPTIWFDCALFGPYTKLALYVFVVFWMLLIGRIVEEEANCPRLLWFISASLPTLIVYCWAAVGLGEVAPWAALLIVGAHAGLILAAVYSSRGGRF